MPCKEPRSSSTNSVALLFVAECHTFGKARVVFVPSTRIVDGCPDLITEV